jgi:catechol 2,3-dioxygenase-like lactoylglutathione lyase family enzyme
MSPADRPVQDATLSHFGLSVGDLDAMAAFYTRLGFDETARVDFAPAPVRLALVRNQAGITLELTAHRDSAPAAPAASAMETAKQRGSFRPEGNLSEFVSPLPHPNKHPQASDCQRRVATELSRQRLSRTPTR